MNFISNKCIPSGVTGNMVFSESRTPDERRRRDERICACFQAGAGNGFENGLWAEGQRDNNNLWLREQVRASMRTQARTDAAGMVEEFINEERYLNAFSVMSYAADSREASELAGRYTPASQPEVARALGRYEGIAAVLQKPLDEDVLRGANAPETSCVDFQTFLASRQFPKENEFYEELQSGSFRSDDWNFKELAEDFKEIRQRREFQNLGFEALLSASPEAARIERRMTFLNDNPAIRNVFMSNGDKKAQLFGLLRSMPRPTCRGQACLTDQRWQSSYARYSESLRVFFRDGNVRQQAIEGLAKFTEYTIGRMEDRAAVEAVTIDNLPTEGYRTNPSEWPRFCAVRTELLSQSRRDPLLELESSLEDRHPQHPDEDDRFNNLNIAACETPRVNASGESLSFAQYAARHCGDPCTGDQRREHLLAYLLAYRAPDGEEHSDIEALIPFLDPTVAPPTLNSGDASRAARIAATPGLSRSSVDYVPASRAGSTPETRVTSVDSRNVTRSSSRGDVSSGSSTSLSAPLIPTTGELISPVSQTPRETARVESLRQELNQGESEANTIRSEIANLRETLQRPETTARSSQDLSGLTERLQTLEDRLRLREEENSRLRSDIAAATQPRERSEIAGGSESGRREFSSFNSSSGQIQGGGTSAAAPSGVAPIPTTSGGGLGGASTEGAARGRQVSSSSALLERYGISPDAQGSSGGIVVAAATNSVNFQLLRQQSENSVLPLTVSPEEFSRITSDSRELSRYLDRIRAVPGEVVRINLTGGEGQNLELFVVKTGETFSVVQGPGPGRAIASEEPVRERGATLRALRTELDQGR